MAKRQIILLTYVNRSGSTFLLSTLNKRPEICCCPEAEILMELFLLHPQRKPREQTKKKLTQAITNDSKLKHWKLNQEQIELAWSQHTNIECFEEILNAYCESYKPEAKFIVFKAEYLVFLHKKLKKFNYLWIELVRDCRAVFNSQSKTLNPYTGKFFSDNSIETALFWKKHISVALSCNDNKLFRFIQYENLIGNHDSTLNELIEFLGLEQITVSISENTTDFILPEQEKIHLSSNQEPKTNYIYKWNNELSRNDLHIIQKITFKQLHRFNYSLVNNEDDKAIQIFGLRVCWVKLKGIARKIKQRLNCLGALPRGIRKIKATDSQIFKNLF